MKLKVTRRRKRRRRNWRGRWFPIELVRSLEVTTLSSQKKAEQTEKSVTLLRFLIKKRTQGKPLSPPGETEGEYGSHGLQKQRLQSVNY